MTGSGTTRAQFRPPMPAMHASEIFPPSCSGLSFCSLHRGRPKRRHAAVVGGGGPLVGGWNMFPRTDVTSGWICRTLSEGGAGTAAGRKEVEMA